MHIAWPNQHVSAQRYSLHLVLPTRAFMLGKGSHLGSVLVLPILFFYATFRLFHKEPQIRLDRHAIKRQIRPQNTYHHRLGWHHRSSAVKVRESLVVLLGWWSGHRWGCAWVQVSSRWESLQRFHDLWLFRGLVSNKTFF